MLALFCLRLALGMMACLLVLSPSEVNPRFYRTHALTALGLACVALLTLRNDGDWLLLGVLTGSMVLAFVVSFVWSLEGAPGGVSLVGLSVAALLGGLVLLERKVLAPNPQGTALLGDFASAGLLGAAVSAMLMGHMYLIAPSMSLSPLMRLLALTLGAILLRLAVDGFVLWQWTSQHSFSTLGNDKLLWLPVRWLVGFLLPLVLLWMAWQSAKIRSTQSATGILYVVVIFCFLGELLTLLLRTPGLVA